MGAPFPAATCATGRVDPDGEAGLAAVDVAVVVEADLEQPAHLGDRRLLAGQERAAHDQVLAGARHRDVLEPPALLALALPLRLRGRGVADRGPEHAVRVGRAHRHPAVRRDQDVGEAAGCALAALVGKDHDVELEPLGSVHRHEDDRVAALLGDRRLALARALADDAIAVAYQPIVALADGSIAGAEALARWTHPEFGPIAPEVFVAVAEASGLIELLGERVLTKACRDARPSIHAVAGFQLSVNLSPRQLDSADFAPRVMQILAATGCQATRAADGGRGDRRVVAERAPAGEPPGARRRGHRARDRRLRKRPIAGAPQRRPL